MRRIVVRRSPVHGRGVFALTKIRSGELLVEYKGEVTSWRVASPRYQRNGAEDGHTFFFGLDDRYVIDGARGGNLHVGSTIAASRTVRRSKKGVVCLSGRSPTSRLAKSCSSTIYSTSKAGARRLSKSCMLVDAAPGIAEDPCLPHGKSNAAF